MNTFAFYRRVLQFRAGPNEHTFYACEQHKADLERGDYNGVFFPTTDESIQPLGSDDQEQVCDYCREG